jgi:hypothetical protein
MPAFGLFIGGRRRKLERGLIALLETWLATVAVYRPDVRTDVKITLEWPELVPEDKAIRLQYIKLALDQGLITGVTGLELMSLVDDAKQEYMDAQKEADDARQRQADIFDRAMERDANAPDDVQDDEQNLAA